MVQLAYADERLDTMSHESELTSLLKDKGVIRSKDAEAHGIPRQYLHRMVEQQKLERVGWGLYTLPDSLTSTHHSLAIVQARVPQSVVCLLSALQYHDITTQIPYEVWIAVEGTAWSPVLDYPAIHLNRFSGQAFQYGVEVHEIDGVAVRVYSVAKTVADCFKFRYKVGVDVALEALKQVIRERRVTIDQIWTAAKVCRVSNVMKPYLEVL
jgi:predicted transcriptional regulator of viral defense system